MCSISERLIFHERKGHVVHCNLKSQALAVCLMPPHKLFSQCLGVLPGEYRRYCLTVSLWITQIPLQCCKGGINNSYFLVLFSLYGLKEPKYPRCILGEGICRLDETDKLQKRWTEHLNVSSCSLIHRHTFFTGYCASTKKKDNVLCFFCYMEI